MRENSDSSAGPLAHVLERLNTAIIVSEPYPHYYLENVFPAEYYQAILQHIPSGDTYENLHENTTLQLDHLRYRYQKNMGDGWTESLPAETKAFWENFNSWFFGIDLAQAVLDSFGGPLRERYGEKASWPPVSVESYLIRHEAGYFLEPHSDLYTKIIVLLIYLPLNDDAQHIGTSLYRPKDASFSCPDSVHYPFDDFIRVETAPYRPNSLLAFERSDRSFHGVEPLSEQDAATCNRDLIQYALYDKRTREAQLRERALAGSKGAAE